MTQVYGKADVSHAVNALSGGAKKAAGDALHKALSSATASKADVPALDVAAVASYAISVSCETSPTAPAPQQHFLAAQQVLPAGFQWQDAAVLLPLQAHLS